MLAKSLPLKIAAIGTLALAAIFGAGAFIMTARSAGALNQQNSAIQAEVANSQAQAVTRRLDLAAKVADGIATTALSLKASGATDRAVQDAMLKAMLEQNPDVLGTYSAYEPNALDGKDAEFAGTDGSDASGRFISYWNSGSGEALREVLVDYEVAGAGDYYQLPKTTGRAVAIEPYLYPVAGKEMLITSFVRPLVYNGEFIGIGGVDIGLGALNAEMSAIKPFETGFVALVSSKGLAISYPNAEVLGKPLADVDAATARAASEAIAAGEQIAFDAKGTDGQSWRYLAVPIRAGLSDDMWAVVVEVPVATLNAQVNDSIRTMAIVSIISILVAVALLYVLVTRLVGVPLKNLGRVFDRMASGDHNAEVREARRSDEIGAIGKAVMGFRDSLRAKAQQDAQADLNRREEEAAVRKQVITDLAADFENNVGSIVEMVSSAATEMQATAQQLTSSAQESAHQARSVSVAAEEAGTNVTSVAGAAEELGASVSEISRQVEHSLTKAREAVTEADATTQVVQELSEAAGRITGIVDMISGIAAQTNLLALNATIESARAGEAGKGFAVVASEVKALAQQTTKATEEINTQIAAIQATTRRAVSAIETITHTIRDINDSSATIAAAVDQQGGATSEIVQAVSQASAGTQEVTSNIVGVARMAEDTGAGASQVLSASSELAQQAEMLRHQVNSFLSQVRAS